MAGQKAYEQAIGRGLNEEELLAQDNSLLIKEQTQESIQKAFITLDWIQHTCTIEMMQSINNTIQSLQDSVIELGANYYTHQNHLHIVSILQKIHTLKQIIKLYGTRN